MTELELNDCGIWVKNADLPPHANISGRVWRNDDGSAYGVAFRGADGRPRNKPFSWFFPAQVKTHRGETK